MEFASHGAALDLALLADRHQSMQRIEAEEEREQKHEVETLQGDRGESGLEAEQARRPMQGYGDRLAVEKSGGEAAENRRDGGCNAGNQRVDGEICRRLAARRELHGEVAGAELNARRRHAGKRV